MDGLEFLPFDRVAQESGVTPWTLRRRLRQAGLPLWSDPTDRRRRLIRLADVDALTTPQRIGAKEREPMTAA